MSDLGALARVDPLALGGDDARIAFWISAYNALLLEELKRNPRTGSVLRHRRMFRSVSCRVGEREYSLDVIEHGILRRNARPPYAARRVLRNDDPRRQAMPSRLDPRVHFALNCGAVSCPPIRRYSAAGLDAELEATTSAYMRAETAIDRDAERITLPYLMRLYSPDFGDRGAALEFAARHLDADDGAWVREGGPKRVRYGKFDWTLAEP